MQSGRSGAESGARVRRKDYFLGLDGGGTKTLAVVLDSEGHTLSSVKGPKCPVIGEPTTEQSEVLTALVRDVLSRSGLGISSVRHCGIGLNGIDFEDEYPLQLETLAEALSLPTERITAVNDGIGALWGASGAQALVLIQHGTGYTSAYRQNYGEEKLFDHLNVGRMFDIRRGLMALIARMIDGREEPSPLLDTMLKYFGVESDRYAEAAFRGWIPADKRMNTGPLIFKAWEEGDPGATQLVETAAKEYIIAIRAMLARIDHPSPAVVLGGGLLNHASQRFIDKVAQGIQGHHPEAAVGRPELQPGHGTAIMAAFHAGDGGDSEAFFSLVKSKRKTDVKKHPNHHRGCG